MKRADIKVGCAYKVSGHTRPLTVREFTASGKGVHFVGYLAAYPLNRVLMPWPQWEAEQKAKAERDAAVRGERTRNEEMVGFELRGKLVAAGVRIQAWDPERRTVTFRWEDAAKLIGGSS